MANCAPQKPAAHTTTSASSTPSAVRTPVTRSPLSRMPSTSVCGSSVAPRALGAPGLRFGGPQRLGQPVGRGVEPPEDLVRVDQRVQRRTLGGGEQPALDPPGLRPAGLAVQVGPALGGGGDLEATDRVEGPAAADAAGAELLDGVARRTRVIVFDGLVWNTSPGAWEVEPPVANSGPRSTTVTSVQPRAVSSSASDVPTMPAPITTTLGMAPPLSGHLRLLKVAHYAT